jgi:type VI secretion system protein ImpG
MFAKYYQAELQFLRELGRSFGETHPDSAAQLVERGGDPDVERLLEGFSFLTAQLRERADDAVPEIVVALADLLLPHYARTIPACSIVEFSPIPGAVRGRQRIDPGAEVASVPVDGTACRFRTTMPVDLLPLQLTELTADGVGSNTPSLRASFQLRGQAHDAVFHPDGIRLYVHGELPAASTLFLWFLRHCDDVVVTGASGKKAPVRLGKAAIRPSGLDASHPMFPWPPFAPAGYRLLQEFFVLPSKLLFFDVVGLDRAASVAEEKFDLTFQFNRPPELPSRPARDALRLFCAPVVNLFATSADPIERSPTIHEHLLRGSDVSPIHAEIYSVDAVAGARSGRGERRVYHPFFDYRHAVEGRDTAYYRVRRRPSVLDDGLDTYLSIVTPRNVAPSTEEETLSIDLTCTNRSLPAKLRTGDISAATSLSPTTAKFRNIAGVSRPVRPPLGSELHWRLLSHLALNQRSLGEAEALRSLLALYNFVERADEQVGRANRLRVEGIQRVAVEPAKCLLDGAPVRGARFALELDERNFASRGDAFLFGAVVDELLSQHVTLNSFTELILRLQPSQAEYAWAPRNGKRSLV